MQQRVVIVGGGFAGLSVAHRLQKRLGGVDVTLVNPDDYSLYLPLLPQVASGVLPARAVVVPLDRQLRRTTLVSGRAVGVDLDARRVVVTGITGDTRVLPYDRLVLAPGSVTRISHIPGLPEWGRGMKTLAEAVYLHDHVLAQLEAASVLDDPDERARRCRFVVVGGGYAGVETVANLQLMTTALVARFRRLDPALVRWHLVEHGDRLMPELDASLGADARAVLERRGVQVEVGVGLVSADAHSVTLSDGRRLETETLVWTAGVAPNPLMGHLGLDTDKGRLVVGADLAVPGRPEVLALGDAAAVPDLAAGGGAICATTAQHATRQAPVAARNVAAALRGEPNHVYRHRDLGLVVDLGGADGVAAPLGVRLTGRPAQVVTRAYHLWAVGVPDTMRRVAANWVAHGVGGDEALRLGFTRAHGRLAEFEATEDYLAPQRSHAIVAGTAAMKIVRAAGN